MLGNTVGMGLDQSGVLGKKAEAAEKRRKHVGNPRERERETSGKKGKRTGRIANPQC